MALPTYKPALEAVKSGRMDAIHDRYWVLDASLVRVQLAREGFAVATPCAVRQCLSVWRLAAATSTYMLKSPAFESPIQPLPP